MNYPFEHDFVEETYVLLVTASSFVRLREITFD